MNNFKFAILGLAILFLIATTFFDVPKTANNIIYGIMAIFSILFLFFKRKELSLDSMFHKKENQED